MELAGLSGYVEASSSPEAARGLLLLCVCFIFIFQIILFIYFCLCWVLVAVTRAFLLAAEGRAYFLVAVWDYFVMAPAFEEHRP